MPYPEMLVAPMRAELTRVNFTELTSAEDVETKMSQLQGKTALVVVNSVCGCAAGAMRPGVLQSLQNDKTPDELLTVFAGQDMEATAKVREYMVPYPPSSPSVALFKDGRLVHFVERQHIEGRTADMLAKHLQTAYNEFC
jgi:putative YphP/YqiW family bacilliredoxin